MEDIENYSQQITTLMKEYEEIVIQSNLYESNRIKWKQLCSQKQKKLKNLILSMKQQMAELSSSTAAPFQVTLKQHQTKLGIVMQEYQRKLKVPVKIETMRKEIPKLKEEEEFYSNRTVESYFQKGDKQMARMEDAVQNMNIELEEGIRLAEEVNMELHRQIEQLDNIQDTVKDTKSTLKRADRIISFFAKAAQCDKCILALVLMNILAGIAFFVLITKKK